ncbi:hypothetical protein ACQPXB_21175 [Amycolatopsis sp. CA-161197]|uniref:hypothetical protein n=1 Tax=Amycolatopsis sp. CA-161197 TaxID=3239922 RepID=UPI003D8FFDA2
MGRPVDGDVGRLVVGGLVGGESGPQDTVATCTVTAFFEPGVVTVIVAAVPLGPPDAPGDTVRLPALRAAALMVVTPLWHFAEKGPTLVPPTRTLATVASASPAPARRVMPLATTAPDGDEADPPPERMVPLLAIEGAGPKCSPPSTLMPPAVDVLVAAAATLG